MYTYRYNQIGQTETTLATLGGLYVADYAAEKLSSTALKPAMKHFYSIPDISQEDGFVLVDSMRKNKKLKDLEINLLDKNDLVQIKNQILEVKTSMWDKFLGRSKDFYQKLESVANGKNAFFLPRHNKIYAPKDKPTMILHEIGHALNNKAFWGAKTLQTIGYSIPKYVAPLILSSAIWNSLRAPKQESFTKDNVGLLTMACFVPTLVDEAAASLRVIKNSVKNNMPKVIIKNQKKFLGLAFCSYLGLTVASGIVATGLVKLASFYHNWRNKN